MKKYEYKVVTRYVDINSFKKDLNQWGLEGWEYVLESVVNGVPRMIFKRELPQDWVKESLEKVEEITEDQREEELVTFDPTGKYPDGHLVQECYNQCLAVECGEGECAKAIATKFPEYVSKYEEKVERDRKDHQALREESLREARDISINKKCLTVEPPIYLMDIVIRDIPTKYADAWRALLDDKKGG